MEESRNVRKFKSDYNELDRFFTQEVNGPEGHFYENMLKFLRLNPRYQHFKNDIDYINEVRKIVTHKENMEGVPVIPTDALCNKLEYTLKQIKNPPKWSSIAIPANQIYSCTEEDSISDVVKEMANNTYTHVPVVKDGLFEWLLSESVFVQWLSEIIEKEEIITEATSVSQLRKYAKNTNDAYEFLSRDTDIYTIKEKFENAIKEKRNGISKRLGVIFITNSGRESEKILGLITAWDVGKISLY
ncbi:MAG: CBS domain-containing protein [Methanomicrobiales archaeon]|nr:CBS domain-containing protein [Methanomicrobiales archaeon]